MGQTCTRQAREKTSFGAHISASRFRFVCLKLKKRI